MSTPEEVAKMLIEGECPSGAALTGLPRFDKSFAGVETDWSKLPPLLTTCEENGIETFCVNEEGILNGEDMDINALINAEGLEWVRVGQSYGVYAGLCIAMFVLTLVFLVMFIVVKLMCCCRRRCKGKKESDSDEIPMSRTKQIFCKVTGLVCLLFMVLFIMSFTVIADKRGNKGFTDTQKIFVTGAPVGAARFLSGIPNVFEKTVAYMGGTAIVSVLEIVNKTITGTVDLGVVSQSFTCLDDTLTSFSGDKISEFATMLDDIESAIDSFPNFTLTKEQIGDLNTQLSNIGPVLDEVREFLVELDANLTGLDFAPLQVALSSLNSTLNEELTPGIEDLKADLQVMQTNIPVSADLSAFVTSLENFRSNPDNTGADGVITEANALSTKLANIPVGVDVKIVNVQNLFNQTVQSLGGVRDQLDASRTAIDALPGRAQVEAVIDPLRDVINAVQLDGIRTSLQDLGGAVNLLPTDISSKVSELTSVTDNVPCIMEIVGELDKIQTNLIVLPGEMANISLMLIDMNTTISSSLSQVGEIETMLDDMQTQLDNLPDTASYIATIDDLDVKMNSSMSSLNVGDQMQTVDDKRAGIDLGATITSIDSLRTELGSGNAVDISPAELDTLRTLNTTTSSAITMLNNFVDAINAWKANGDVCLSESPGSACGPTVDSPPCSETACSWHTTEQAINSTIDEMNSLSTTLNSLPDLGGIITGLDSGLASITAVPAIDPALISDLDATITSFQGELGGYQTTVVNLRADLDAGLADMDLISVQSQIDDADASLSGVGNDISSFGTTLSDLNATLGENTMGDMASSLADMINALHKLFYKDLGKILTRIRGDKVQTEINSNGLFSALMLVAHSLEEVIQPFMSIEFGAEEDTTEGTQTIEEEEDGNFTAITDMLVNSSNIFHMLEAASVGPTEEDRVKAFKDGHLSFILRALAKGDLIEGYFGDAAAFDSYKTSESIWLSVEGAFDTGSKEMKVYDNDMMCLSDECLKNTIAIYNTQPVQGLPLGREQAFQILFIFPAILIILAFVAMVCSIRGKACTTPLVCFGCCVTPFFFLVGVLFLPSLMFLSDFCENMEPVILTGITAAERGMCETFGMNVTSGPSETSFCFLEFEGERLEIDLDEIFRSILDSCEGRSFANLDGAASEPVEPIAQLWEKTKVMSRSIVASQVLPLLESNSTTFQPKLNQSIMEVLDELATSVEVLADEASEAFDCESLSLIFDTVKEPLCCNVVDSFFWLTIPWVLIGLSVVSCTIPVMCCVGRKQQSVSKVFAK